MDSERRNTLQSLSNKELHFGSDCSGADAAFQAATMWTPYCQCTATNEMMSEAPDAEAPMLFGLLNHRPSRLFRDMLRRGFSGYDLISDSIIKAPLNLDYYTAGTMCTDFSSLNTVNPKQYLISTTKLFNSFLSLCSLSPTKVFKL